MLQIANNHNVKKGSAKKDQNYKFKKQFFKSQKAKKQFKRKGPQKEDTPIDNTSTLFNFF